MNTLVISCSHNPKSRSAILAREALAELKSVGAEAEWVNLAQIELPLCDGGACYGHANVGLLSEKIITAQGILLAAPIYNYDLNAAAKNLLELTGRNWTGKVVGFACAAGGQGSYMSIMPFANSLMLDFRCIIVPRFVYATGAAFDENSIVDAQVQQRLTGLARDLFAFSNALQGLTEKQKPDAR